MTAHALVTGTVFRDPEQRSSKAEKAFAVATIKAKDGDAVQWWKVLALSDTAQAELMRLSADEAVSVHHAVTRAADGSAATAIGQALDLLASSIWRRRNDPASS